MSAKLALLLLALAAAVAAKPQGKLIFFSKISFILICLGNVMFQATQWS